jgi:hypothetical protein
MKSVTKYVYKGEVNTRKYFKLVKRDSNGQIVPYVTSDDTITIDIYDVTRSTLIVTAGTIVKEDDTLGTCYFITTSASSLTVGRYLAILKFAATGGVVRPSKEFNWVVLEQK